MRLGPDGLLPSANVSILFRGHPIADGLRMAKEVGFRYVEAWWPFASPFPDDAEVDQFLGGLEGQGLQLTGLNFFAGDMAAGERGVVSHAESEVIFREHVPVALDIAMRAGCGLLNALYGNSSAETTEEEQRAVALRSYAFAAERAREQGATVLLETVNPHENPRYPVTRLDEASEIVAAVGGPAAGIGLLFDAYHVQRTEGDLTARFERHAELVQHVQIADAPRRSAPGTGEIAYERVLPAMQGLGYHGFVGLEYVRGTQDEGFDWVDGFGRSAVTGGQQ
jgi:hydroxypyruvate isomerase